MTTPKTFDEWLATRLENDEPVTRIPLHLIWEAGRALGTHEGRIAGIEEAASAVENTGDYGCCGFSWVVRALTQTPNQEGE